MKTLEVKYYKRPTGEMRVISMSNIYPEDVDFFEDNDIVVSVEETQLGIVVYGCPRSDKTEESEIVIFAGSQKCEETMQRLRWECEKAFDIGG